MNPNLETVILENVKKIKKKNPIIPQMDHLIRKDLKFDSLDFIELLDRISEELGVDIDPHEVTFFFSKVAGAKKEHYRLSHLLDFLQDKMS